MSAPSPAPSYSTLKKRKDFLRLNGKDKWVTPRFIMLSSPRIGEVTPTPRSSSDVSAEALAKAEAVAQTNIPRVGYTVTKKLGNAVARNRIKRRLREAVRATAGEHAKPGRDYVLIARAEALQCEYDALIRDLQTAFSRIGRPVKPKHAPVPPSA